jgi:hypothetical protein
MSVTFYGTNHNVTRTVNFSSGETHTIPTTVHMGEGDEDILDLNLSNMNASALLKLLGFEPMGPDGMVGEVTVPEMRRAIMRAVNTFDSKAGACTRATEIEYGKPRDNGDGTIELRPVRVYSQGIDEEYLSRRLAQLAENVEVLVKRGATHITWA